MFPCLLHCQLRLRHLKPYINYSTTEQEHVSYSFRYVLLSIKIDHPEHTTRYQYSYIPRVGNTRYDATSTTTAAVVVDLLVLRLSLWLTRTFVGHDRSSHLLEREDESCGLGRRPLYLWPERVIPLLCSN